MRVDILVKEGNLIKLIEVKAKSYNPDGSFLTGKGTIVAKWKPYLYDVAFQKYVAKKAFPDFEITPYLLLVDKTKEASIDGLNQRFIIQKKNGRVHVQINSNIYSEDLGNSILNSVDVTNELETIFSNKQDNFENLISKFEQAYIADEILFNGVGSKCSKCEFHASSRQLEQGCLSGYQKCWKEFIGLTDADLKKPLVNSIWYFLKKDKLISEGRYFQKDVTDDDLGLKQSLHNGLSRTQRQRLQIQKSITADQSIFLLKAELKLEMEKWQYPLHFIDFETTTVAIPFNTGRRPYEQIAFQFSHHVVNSDHSITHQGEWINTQAGYFPNFEFVRQLKGQLENDNGSIFRYSAHENNILCAIVKQLENSDEPDKDELCEWIKSITKSTSSSKDIWQGERNMVDLLDMVVKYYYHVSMEGSNSIKTVLPAILNTSEYLKEKYSQPIYGIEIPSYNFNNQVWIQLEEDGLVRNPYEHLPAIFEGIDFELLDTFTGLENAELNDGGAAMMAYAKMQFSEITNEEREHITNALLRYCELDTMAMVMIWEAWNDWINN